MSVPVARRVLVVLGGAVVVMLAVAMVCDNDPTTTSNRDLAFDAAFLVSMLALAGFAYFAFRCPRCKRHLSRPEVAAMKCRDCGCAFAEPNDARESV